MYALSLILPDNTILEGGTFLQQEDSIGIAALSLVITGTAATVILSPTAVEGLPGGDGDNFAVGLGRCCCGKATSVTVAGDHCRQEESSKAGEFTKGYHGSWVIKVVDQVRK